MVNIAHGGMDHRASTGKPKMPPKELEHIRLSEAENGGHVAESHFTSYEHSPEQHVFGAPAEGAAKPMLPEGHVLHHVAKAMHIPHSVIEAKNESAAKVDSKAHEPSEEEEIEEAE